MGSTDVGAVVIVATSSRLDYRVIQNLVSIFPQNSLCLSFIQLAFGVCERHSLALGTSSEVTVAVDGVEVFGDGVLVVVAVRTKFLFRAVGMVNILWRRKS